MYYCDSVIGNTDDYYEQRELSSTIFTPSVSALSVHMPCLNHGLLTLFY